MAKQEKHLIVSAETHQMVKERAIKNNVTIEKQIRMMLVATETDKKD